MRMSLDALLVLDAIARNGSFARAANELHRVPSALTYTVQQLESDLDIKLFQRDGRRAALTAAGHELLNEGRVLLRAASDLESRIQQVARGWETELRIAIDTIIDIEALYPMVARFDTEHRDAGTRIRLATEVLGGTWDALLNGRADMIIGASNITPAGGGFATLPLGDWHWLFCAAPKHAITKEKMPLDENTISRYRAVSVADSSRNLPPRTVGLISGQDVFTVPTMAAKCHAQVAGLGVGFLPEHLARPFIKAKKLVAIAVDTPRPVSPTCIAWRPNRTGRALRWFVQQFEDPAIAKEVFGVERD
jgi:DNA-binding transcriptional LysR family regulator